MSSENNNGFRKIVPLSDHSTANNSRGENTLSLNIDAKKLFVVIGFIFLFITAFTVIFLLPSWVKESTPHEVTQVTPSAKTSTTQVTSSDTSSPPKSVSATDKSPWEKTQSTEIRKDTQQVLQQMLEAQKKLEQNKVEAWAKNEYDAAISIAQQGDAFYNEQKFIEAQTHYKNALADFNTLIEQIDTLYRRNIEAGNTALETGKQANAIKAFETALLFEEQTGEASKGLERAKILDQVFAKIHAGDDAVNAGDYNQANTFYKAALQLDPLTTQAKDKLADNHRRLNDIQFKNHMTAGFRALEKQQFQTARNEFNRALKLKPNSNEATSALLQTNVQSTNNAINTALHKAQNAEAKEDWQSAINYYKTALKQDKTLSAGITGLKNAEAQLATYNKITAILSQTERLNEQTVFNEVQAFYETLSQLSSPGPILSKQIKQLEQQLAISATPVNVQLLSDNQTEVTVYKVGKMGAFESKAIRLRPGKYTAIGIRPGYRDVRVEFLVSAQKDNAINIRSSEKIN